MVSGWISTMRSAKLQATGACVGGAEVAAVLGPNVGTTIVGRAASVDRGGVGAGLGSIVHGTGVGKAPESSLTGAALGPHADAAATSPSPINQRARERITVTVRPTRLASGYVTSAKGRQTAHEARPRFWDENCGRVA